ncbi:hypothetical protein [Edaphocola aurantiacus]|uniref:hypothetical protein n=1 Tax=Edaphocola aurantiacus TaxID=2601682 RepID=UPI001C96C57A|nr:hypothetical protein [Edaphocola aurantiacus]
MKHFYSGWCKAISVCTFIFGCHTLTAQNNLGIGTASPSASAKLDVSSTTQGLLTPRMTQAQRNAISSPATGLLIYQTDNTPGFYFYNGAWTALSGSGGSSSSNILYSELAAQFTVSTSSPTYSNVVSLTLEANKTYRITGMIYGQRAGGTNAPMTVRYTYSGNATTTFGVSYSGSLIPGTVFNSTGTHDLEAAGFGNSATATVGIRYTADLIIKTTTGGTFTIQTARTTTNTTLDFIVREGSFLMATPI